LRESLDQMKGDPGDDLLNDDNQPIQLNMTKLSKELCASIFDIAEKNVNGDRILANIQRWMQENKLSFLTKVINRNLSLADVIDAVRKYKHMASDLLEMPATTKSGIEVALIRRFFSSQLEYINTAKQYISITDFFDLIDHILYTSESHGKLGGKSAGLNLAKYNIDKSPEFDEFRGKIKIPKTWYITSDVMVSFLDYNNLSEVVEQKYKDINQVRLEYPHVIQLFKNSN